MRALSERWRIQLLCGVSIAATGAMFLVPAIPQDPAYHLFADPRTLCGVPNFWNVFSNLAFLLIGAFGLLRLARLPAAAPRGAYRVFCIGVVFVGLGSAYYHAAPTTQTLLWDRLPMTVAFMALFSMVLRDRVSLRLGNALLWPLVAIGAASVFYWYWTELQGRGDLRVYGLVQFLPMLLIPLMLLAGKGRLDERWLWGTLATYALSKVAEYFDLGIYQAIGLSGHSIKHVLAALAVLWAVFAVLRARPSPAA